MILLLSCLEQRGPFYLRLPSAYCAGRKAPDSEKNLSLQKQCLKSPWQPNSFEHEYRKQWLMGLPSLPENKVLRHREVPLSAAHQRFLRFVKKNKGTTEVDCQSRLQGAHSKAQYGQSNKTPSAEDKNLHFNNKEKSMQKMYLCCYCTLDGEWWEEQRDPIKYSFCKSLDSYK